VSGEERVGVLFNDLVGTGKDRGRDCKAARVRGLEVDDKLEFGRAGSGPPLYGLAAGTARAGGPSLARSAGWLGAVGVGRILLVRTGRSDDGWVLWPRRLGAYSGSAAALAGINVRRRCAGRVLAVPGRDRVVGCRGAHLLAAGHGARH
jgi:hypothetical protein